MKYAVIKTGGKQYKVSEGDVINVEHLADASSVVTFSDVLLYAADSTVLVGAPIVPGVTVSATLIGDTKGEKIRVAKFKAKARYRRVTGHRQSLTQVKIDSIVTKGTKEVKEPAVSSEPKVVKSPAKKTVEEK